MSGARMIPNSFLPDSPPGERDVFERLKSDPACKGWIVLHSLDLARHVKQVSGEADFVVIVPEQGVVVLEVKSHEFIKLDERGWWLGSSSTPEARGPFKQAAHAMHSIRLYVGTRLPILAGQCPFISGVVFPAVSFAVNSPEWHAWQVIDKRALNAGTLSARVLAMLHHARAHFNACGLRGLNAAALTAKSVYDLSDTLRPKFEFFIKPADKIKKLQTGLLKCTAQQFQVLDLIADNDRVLIHGPAGTGKTCLALEILRREKATRPSSSVALFCFNKLLGEKLEQDVTGLGVGNVKAGHIHSWLVTLVGRIPPNPDADYWSSGLPTAAAEILLQTGPVLDLLIVDEAQDLISDAYLDVFDLVLKGGLQNGRFLFLGDFERQAIFAPLADGKTPLDIIKRRASHGFARLRLNINCRNTAEISNFVETLGHLQPGYSSVLRGDTHVDPSLEFYATEDEALSKLSDKLRELLKMGLSASDIVILSAISEQSSAARLSAIGNWKGVLVPYSSRTATGRIRYTTIHAFKGLEAPAVVVTDIEKLDSVRSGDLFYIALSRALHRLDVLAHARTQEPIRQILNESISHE
jgi:hypothetical protein